MASEETQLEVKKTTIAGWFSVVLAFLGTQTALILLVAIAAVAVTVILYFAGAPTDTSFQGAIYASWIAGVAFFVIAGAASTIIAIFPPHKASYDARARILFRGQDGRHINYIIRKITKQLEQYTEKADRTLTITKYDQASGKYFIQSQTGTILRSYIDDMESVSETYAELVGCTNPPPGKEPNRILYLRLGDKVVQPATEVGTGKRTPFEVKVPPGDFASVEFKAEYWVNSVDDPCTHKAVRYVKRFHLTLQNDSAFTVPYKVQLQDKAERSLTLAPHSKEVFEVVRDVEGGQRIYRIDLLPIEATGS